MSSAVIFVDKKTPVTFFFDNDNTYNLERAQKAFHSDTQGSFVSRGWYNLFYVIDDADRSLKLFHNILSTPKCTLTAGVTMDVEKE